MPDARRFPLPRHLPMLVSVAATRFRDDPGHALSKLRRVLPVGGSVPMTDGAAAAVQQACFEDDPFRATEYLAEIPDTDPQYLRLSALVARCRGDLLGAQKLAAAALGASRGIEAVRARGLLREIIAERRSMDPAWQPTAPQAPPFTPVPGRVLHLVTFALPQQQTGYTVRTQEIAVAQRAAGFDPHVVTRLGYPMLRGHWDAADTDIVDGIAYHHLSVRRPFHATATALIEQQIEATAELVQRLRPQLLHAATDHVNGRVALALRERFGLPVVYEVRGFLEDSWLSRHDMAGAADTERYLAARHLESLIVRRAYAVTTLGTHMRAEIIARGAEPDQVFIAPNGVDPRFLEDPPDATGLREDLGIDPGERVIGTITTLLLHEGVDTLLRAARRVLDTGVPLRVLVVGDGPRKAYLQQLADELGLGDRVIFPGRVPFADVAQWYAALDVFCVPRVDARVTRLVTPLKPVEAMAMGVPVLGSDLPALHELIGDGRGWFARAQDPDDWADQIIEVLASPQESGRRAAVARTWVQHFRRWPSIARTYQEVYGILGTVPKQNPTVGDGRVG